MKVKEIDRTANVAWSPAAQHPIYLAAGTAAQQLDATFSTTASLEIYSLNLTEPGMDMSLKGAISSDCRFHKLAWGPNGISTSECPYSMIVGGADGGNLFMFDPAKLVKGEMALVCQRDKHTGPVTALDFNPFQLNLLASGASESEIFLWDLNNPNNPMTPGAKSQPGEDVTCVAWNLQVQHILASTFAARCVVWDLRKNEPIIKVSDSTSRIRCKCVAWHPEVATQMCLASEDDHTPVIQLWDLRFATAPLKSLESHQRGVLSIAWCRHDPDLLLSCGKDNRILCWNPNSNVHGGEVLCELPTSSQWSFDVAWCPRNPAVIASSSFDGHVSVYSLMGGQQQVQPSSKIVEAFPGTDPYSQAPPLQTDPRSVLVTLKKPPKWLRTPVRASFAFGGKLVTFENVKSSNQQQQQQQQHQQTPQGSNQCCVYVSQMVTEPTLIARSTQLETTIRSQQFSDFCHLKLSNCTSKKDEKLWRFIKANFDSNPRLSFLNLLGYDPQDISSKITSILNARPDSRNQDGDFGVDAEELAQKISTIGSGANSLSPSPNTVANNKSASRTPDSALNFSGDVTSAFDTIASNASPSMSPGLGVFNIPTDDEVDGLISKALLTGNVETAVDLCLREGRTADAIILAMAGGQDLLSKTQRKYFNNSKGQLTKLIAAVVHQDWGQVVRSCDIACWKEALAACLTYAKPNEFSSLCEILGSRLENERDGDLLPKAMLCYICAGNVEKLADCWVKNIENGNTSKSLQDLVELLMILKHAVDLQGQVTDFTSGILTEKLTQYASLLAAQGSLTTALSYLGTSNEPSILLLRNRLYKAIGQPIPGIPEPASPFPKLEMRPIANGFPNPSQQQQQQQQQQQAKHLAYSTQTNTFPYTPPTLLPTSSYPGASAVQGILNPMGVANYAPVATQPPSAIPPSPLPAANVPPSPTFMQQKRGSFGVGELPLPTPPPSAPGLPNSTAAAPPPPPPTSTQAKIVSKSHLSQRYPSIPQDPNMYGQTAVPSAFMPPGYPQGSVANNQPSVYNSMNNPAMTNYPNPSFYNQPTANAYAGQIPSSMSPSVAPPPPSVPPLINSAGGNFGKPGWNDPPLLKNQSNMKAEFDPPAPITRPIFNAPENDAIQAPYQQHQPGYVNQPNVFTPPQQIPQMQQQQQQQQQQPPQQMNMGTQQAPPASQGPPPAKPKAPIPTENQVLYDVYEDLKARCLAAAHNPQVKRKLDDVSRKLESLYDKLRDNSLSQQTILGLHQIVQAVQQYNYQTALAIHANIISTGTFSEISSFMPALKVLLQTAQQLSV